MRDRACVLLVVLGACGPRLPLQVIDAHPRLELAADRPAVVESSGALPRWVRAPDRGDSDTIVFVGQASASSLESAEKAAGADLSDAVARFIAVSVASEMESTETHESSNGKTTESQEVHAETRAHVEASVGKVAADASYWEKVSARTGPATYRYFLRAAIKKSEVARARLAIACDRARQAGRKIIAVVFVDSMIADLETRLAAESGWLVLTRAELAAASPNGAPETIVASLSPDAVLAARATVRGEMVTLNYALGKTTREVSGASAQLFELEDELWASLQAALRSF
jgi:hypothetical protein